jgi:hypothetical protein
MTGESPFKLKITDDLIFRPAQEHIEFSEDGILEADLSWDGSMDERLLAQDLNRLR